MGIVFNTVKDYLEKIPGSQVVLESIDNTGKSTLVSPLINRFPYFKSYGFIVNDGPMLFDYKLLSHFRILDRLTPISAYTYLRIRYNKPINLEYSVNNIRQFFKQYLSENVLWVALMDDTRYIHKDKGFEGCDYNKLADAYEELFPHIDFCDLLISRKNGFEFRRRKGE